MGGFTMGGLLTKSNNEAISDGFLRFQVAF